MSVVWYWAEGGRREGPMEWARLRDSARAGDFSPEALVWTQGYGDKWRKASTLGEHLFPAKKGEKDASAAGAGDSAEESGAAESAPGPAQPREESPEAHAPPAPSVRIVVRERSPFDSPDPAEVPAKTAVSAVRSLAVAAANTAVVLFKPFSALRLVAFALPVLMTWIGSSTGNFLPLGGSPSDAQSARLARLGLAKVAEPLSGFFEKHGSDVFSPFSAVEPERVMADLAEAVRASSAALSEWFREPGRAVVAAVVALAALAMCALAAWFLSRGWAILLERVYRRDEPSSLSWAAASPAASALFRGVFAVRAATLAAECAAAAVWVRFFSGLPAGGAGIRHAAALALSMAAIETLGAVAAGFVRDFVAPRVMLRRAGFGPALGEALRGCGWWFLRYLALVVPLSLAAQGAAALFVVSAFGVVGGGSALAPLFSVAYSFVVMPWHLLRCLWSLDIVFASSPELRSAVPVSAAEVLSLRRRRHPSAGRYDRGSPRDGD